METQKYSSAVDNKNKLDKPEAAMQWQNFPWTLNDFNKIHKQGHFFFFCWNMFIIVAACSDLFRGK